MSVMKLVSTYAAYSTKPSVKNSSQDDFEQQFCCYLSSDILLPECTSSMPDAFCFLTSSTKANKAAAAGILLQNAKEYAKNHDVIIRDSNTLRRIGLIATAVDVCKKEDANADCIVKIFDDMCTRLVQDSQLTARIVGNIALSTDIRKGFEIMTEGGDSGGFWHARRSMEISLIADFKILVLSEMILSDGKSKLFFKSLLGSKWIERVKVSKLDLSSIVELSRGLINDEHWCTTNCESYLIALIDLITIRAAESDWYYLRSVTYSAADIGTMTVSNIKDKVLELFCGEKTEMILFNLSEENFTKISKAVFKHVCHKMLKPKILENAARIAGELVSGLKKSFLDHIVLRTKRPRCRDVVRGLLEQILLHIFLSPVRSLWPAIYALQISIEKRDEELNSLFQDLMVERLSSSDSEQHLLYIPIHFLVDLPVKKSAALRPLLLRHLWMRGKQLLLDYLHNPQYSAMSLKGTEILLDRFFTVEKISADCTRRDAVIAYLEPIGVLLDGIVSVALTHGSSDADNLSLARAILDALQLPSKTTVFAAVINDADIWLEAKTVTRDILFQTKKMQECFPRFINIAFYSQAIRREQEALDGKLRAENEKGIGEYSLSSLSLSLLSAFGEAVHHQDVVVSYRKVNTQEALSVMLKNCRSRVFGDRDEAVYVNQYVMSYLAATFDYILDSLRKDQYSFPESFDTLPAKMKAVIKGSKSSNCDPQFLILVEMYLDLFEEQILNTLTAFNAKKISKKELDRLDQSPHILRILEKIAHSWELQGVNLQDTGTLLAELKAAEDENKVLTGIVTFLEQRELCTNAFELRRYFVSQGDISIKLCDMMERNDDLTAMLNLEEDILLALKTFSKGSEMFAMRFDVSALDGQDHADSCAKFRADDGKQMEVAARTRNALRELKDLVSNKEVRINDFKLNLTGVIAELKGRRRSAMAAELKRIAQYFSTLAEKSLDSMKVESKTVGRSGSVESKIETSNMLNDTLTNLNAAFNLERLKEVLVPFQTAVRELELLPPSVTEDMQSKSVFHELMGNFYVSDAPRLLGEADVLLEGLSFHALLLVSKLTSADLLLIFLRKHARLFDSGALDRAQQRATSNAHATGVLMHLLNLQTLLEPFYNRTLQSIGEMSRHLEKNLRMSPDGQECLSVAHLTNVCENWDEVEIYFRDSGETNTDTEDIQRSVIVYQETGKFVSALAAHPGGSALSLSYLLRGGKDASLSPEQLQAHVQWAVLGGDIAVLEEFVGAFREAQRAHAIRLELEEEGHPDHQAIGPPPPISVTCRLVDVSDAAATLSIQLSEWRENTAYYCIQSPRLLLLNRRYRVQLLLALRDPALSNAEHLLPYAVQCFPSFFAKRGSVQDALRSSLLKLQNRHNLGDLTLAVQLMTEVQSILEVDPDCSVCLTTGIDDGETPEVTRLDLMGSCTSDIYCQHLSYMVSQTFGAAQPGMVLWGERSTTEREVQDLLLVAGAPGLASAVHVVGVDQLTPRIREVLLRGIENTTLRSPLLLIFGDRDGVDSFSQYKSEGIPEKRVPADVRPHLWSSLSFTGLPNEQNAEVWVLAGKSGMGKTRWIYEHTRKEGLKCLNFTIHEGFTAKHVIDQFTKVISSLSQTNCHKMALNFNVLAEGCCESFARFIHHLLALGLLIDDESGSSCAILPNIQLKVYVELPEVSAEFRATEASAATESDWPPVDESKWTAAQHPLLLLLPTLVVAVVHDHYISIRANRAYLGCRRANLVAEYLLLARDAQGFEAADFPHTADPLVPIDLHVLEDDLFRKFEVSTSKRVRSFLIKLLHDRFLYFRKMLEHVRELKDYGQENEDPLEVRLAGSSRKILLLFIREALDIASNANALPETSVFTIRPERVEEFEVLVTTHNDKSYEFHHLKHQFMESKVLIINKGSIPPALRANVAPAFGMEDTSGFLSTLRDCGHLLTPESLVRVLHMHSRRLLGASIIYEGETGVGKSQNLKLYSLLINSNNSLFANLKLHLVAVIRATARSKRIDTEDTVDDDQGSREAADALSAIAPSSSIAEILVAVTAWVRIDAQVRTNTLGSAVCEYFSQLFKSYPLNGEGLKKSSVTAHKTIQQHVQMTLSDPEDPKIKLAKQIADHAEKADYLMPRPKESSSAAQDINTTVTSNDDMDTVADGENISPSATHLALQNALLFNVDTDLYEFIRHIVTAPPLSLYHRILADEGLTPIKWRNFLDDVVASSVRLLQLSPAAIICVFVDELNTAGCLGMVTEAFLSHSLDGVPLPCNIFFVGAINPLRGSSAPSGTMDFTKSNIGKVEEGDPSDYLAMSPYIVRQLSPGMDNIKMLYPNLGKQGESSFLLEHLQQHICIPAPADTNAALWEKHVSCFIKDATKLIIKAQELVRQYEVPRVYMSIRNLIRCSQLLSWMISFTVPTERGTDGNTYNSQNIFLPPVEGRMDPSKAVQERMRRALIMAISVTYLFQLPSEGHMLAGKATHDLRSRFHSDITEKSSVQDRKMSVKEWKDVIAKSLTYLFSFANIPKGLARTTALKENFYSVVLASINKMPLLITGPPGCGKTLSFLLACDALKGHCPTHTVAFQSLKKARKITYQCSVASTGPEIAAVCSSAHLKQRYLDDQQSGRHVCLLGLDEAGLTPENRQALKSLHDFLDMREIGTVMMSNSTLDAAKTSRTIQLLQTQANMTDLKELAWGIIAAEEAETVSARVKKAWTNQVGGLCTAFQSLSTVILRDNWFHSRDFIFLCRLLRLLALKGAQTLFDSAMLLQALRRHLQPLDPSSFPALAEVFLKECGMQAPNGDLLDARVVDSLRESLEDRLADGTDPTSAHCRYTLVVDPTDCEAGVDLLFALKLLDQASTKIVSLSDFPEDASPTMTTAALAQIKKCIEDGETLLLVNSAPLQSALYDVINRHYAVSVREDGSSDAFANIPLGSFSSLVRVHESFRLIVHVPMSQLPKTPLPFLNRFEKFTLSVRDALAQRVLEVSLNPPHSLLCIPKPEHRKRIFQELEAGVNDFVAFAGGSTSFYGMSSTETVPALVLRALEDACVSTTLQFEPRPSVLAGMMLIEHQRHQEEQDNIMNFMDVGSAHPEQFNFDIDLNPLNALDGEDLEIGRLRSSNPAVDVDNLADLSFEVEEIDIEGKDRMANDVQSAEETAERDLDYASQDQRIDESNIRRRARPRASHSASDNYSNDPLPTRLRALIRALNFQVMETARVESVFRLRGRLPAVYMREYLDNQEHLSVFSLLKQVLKSSLITNKSAGRTTEKLVVYTRTDGHLLRLVTDSAYVERIFGFLRRPSEGSATATATANSAAPNANYFRATIVSSVAAAPKSSPLSTICIIPLAAFSNSGDCARTIAACMCSDGGQRVLIVVADMKQIAAPQVTYARQVIDKEMARCASYQIEYESRQGETNVGFSSLPNIVLLLHVPADQLHQRPCYQTIPLNGWSAVYVDAFCDGLLAADGDTVGDNIELYGWEATSEVGIVGEFSDLSIDHSPQWMRVAFSLDSAPSLSDNRREFSHLALSAIAQAVHAVSFEQRLPMELSRKRRLTRKQYFDRAGIAMSLRAYDAGDKDWVISMLAARPYIMQTLTDSFSTLWGPLVQQTVQEKCERLAMGCTSRGLVESVRASHKWLISDFMHAIIRSDLAADWGLEALASLPEGTMALPQPYDIVTVSINNACGIKEGDNSDAMNVEIGGQTANATPARMAALTIHILRGIVAIRSNDHIQQQIQYSSMLSRVNCTNSPVAPRTPLFQSLMSLLERLQPKVRQRSLRILTREAVVTETQCDTTSLRALLLEDKLYADIARAVKIIEGDDAIFASWKIDFIAVTLRFGGRELNHTVDELTALSLIASTSPGMSMTAKRDLCQWLLLRDSLQLHLYAPSRLLIAAREVFLDADIRDIINLAGSGLGHESSRDDDNVGQDQQRRGKDLAVYDGPTRAWFHGDSGLVHPYLMEHCVRRLWTVMYELAAFGDRALETKEKVGTNKQGELRGVESWMRCVRDVLGIEAFSLQSLSGNSYHNCLSRVDSQLFCVMAAVAQIVAVTGVSLNAFKILTDIDYEGISDLLCITLVLISDAAKELIVTEELVSKTVESRGRKEILGHAIMVCLEWLFSDPHIISASPYKDQLLSGLLGNQNPQDPSKIVDATIDDYLSYAFSAITLNARCHFLDRLMSKEKGMERRVSELLLADEDLGSVNVTYIPEIAAFAANTEPALGLLRSKNCPPDHIQSPTGRQGAGVTNHELIFRIAFLSQMADPDVSSIRKSSVAFIQAYRADRLDTDAGPVIKIKEAARIVHLLNSIAEFLSKRGVEYGLLLTLNPVTEAAALAIATAPGVWSIYLLSRLSNIGVVTEVVQCKELLHRLGMSWIYCELSSRGDMILPKEYEERKREKEQLTLCLNSISLASAIVTFYCQRLELQSTSSIAESMLTNANKYSMADLGDNSIERKAAALVNMLAAPEMSKALAMNIHIPVVLNMHAFLKDRLAYRLQNISVARTLLVADAIDKLPVDDRILGKKLFREFLEAWGSLRSHFRTFDICGREVQAAREIPALTAETTYVSMLVEMEGTEVHESLPAMIIETRLLKLTTEVLRHNTLETLAADRLFNRHEFLAGPVHTESASCLFLRTPPLLLLTGPQTNGKLFDGYFGRVAACYGRWSAHSDIPVLNEVDLVDYESAVNQIKDKIARDLQNEAHKMSLILCPRCGNRFERADGCEHVTCGNHHDPYAGNGGLPPVAAGTCGMQLHALDHRVPAPIAGQPPLACFVMDAESERVPASLLGDDAPNITPLLPPTGEYEFDWIAIASHLFSTAIRGRVDFCIDKDFFSPLAFAIGATENGANYGFDSSRPETLRLPVLKDVTDSPLIKDRNTSSSIRGIGDVYSRLRLAAGKVTIELGDIIRDSVPSPLVSMLQTSKTAFKPLETPQNHVILTKTQMNHVQRAASRQDERALEELCDQALTLCMGMLALIGQGFFDDLGAVSSVTEQSEKHQLKTIYKNISPPVGVKTWSPLLVSIFSDFRLHELFPAFECMATVGAEGVPCSHSTLCAELPLKNRDSLTKLQTKLIEEVKAETCDAALYTDELQTVSSLLTGAIDSLLNESVNKQFIDFSIVAKYVKEHPNTLGTTILARLQVKHYGQVVQFLRQTLGLIAYYSLLAAQLSYDLKGGKHGKGAREAHSGCATESLTETVPITYQELVPDDWECLQNNTAASANSELCIPAPALLLEEELSHVKVEDAGEKVEIHTDSSVAVTERDGDGYGDATSEKLPSPPTAQFDQYEYQAAWRILQNPASAKEPATVSAALNELGADDADSLCLLEEEHIRQLAVLLKQVPSKRFLMACRIVI